MPRFYMDLRECGRTTRDDEGVEQASLEEARQSALRVAREIMCAEVAEGRLCLSSRIEIRDEHGAIALGVSFKDAVTITGA